MRCRGLKKEQKEELECAERVLALLKEETDVRFGNWSQKDTDFLNTWQLLTAKPVVYLVNLSEKDFARKKNKFLAKIFEWVKAHGGEPIIPFSGQTARPCTLFETLKFGIFCNVSTFSF